MEQGDRFTHTRTFFGGAKGDTVQMAKFRAPFLEPVTIWLSNLSRSESLVENYTKGFLEF